MNAPDDPYAVDDHCPECGEPEPECVCGGEDGGRRGVMRCGFCGAVIPPHPRNPAWPADPMARAWACAACFEGERGCEEEKEDERRQVLSGA